MSYKIAIILGSVRQSRRGIRAAKFMLEKCQARGWEAEIIDPMQENLPMLDKRYEDYQPGTAPEKLEALRQRIISADGYIIVTAEYNHSLPPALSNLLDHFFVEYAKKPAGIVSYSDGSFGGVRAAVQARILVGEIGAVTIPRMFPIPVVDKALSENGQAIDKKYDERAKGFLDQFAWYVRALSDARKKD